MKTILPNTPYALKENIGGGTAKSACIFSYRVTPLAYVFAFDVTDGDVYAPYKTDNEPIYNADAVEVFFSPNGNKREYLELEVAPTGVRFFAKIKNGGDKDFKLTISLLSPAFETSTQITPRGYRAELILPLSTIENYDEKKCLLNAYRLDYDAFGALKELQSLAPTLCNQFHRPNFFVHPLAEK